MEYENILAKFSMSLVFAAITPHPPILIPAIGKGQEEHLQKTYEAFLELERELYIAKPSTIIIISPHGGLYPDAFTVNAHTPFQANYIQFGDLTTKQTWSGCPEISANISHKASEHGIKVQLTSQEILDHGSSIPLHFLTKHLPNISILPIGFSGLPAKDHIDFGILLKDVIMESDKRIALVASGDLSHCLTKDSPGGYHKYGKQFDDQFIELLETRNTSGIINYNPKIVNKAEQCGYRSTLILLGVLKNMNYTFKNHCYESPFGVGYLTGQFLF
jgi:AmmeMemoRadiSam system protein B